MYNTIYRSTIGTGGFIATIEIGQFNAYLSAAVGVITFVYMSVSAFKVVKELRDDNK